MTSPDGVLATNSPYWLSINGVWLQVEGVTPGVEVATERASSELVTLDGNRYSQRAPKGMRQWTLSFTYADTNTVSALRAAADSDSDVWLMSEAVGLRNMLPNRACFGTVLPALDCGGVPLPKFAAGSVVTGRVRGGVLTTFSAWSSSAGSIGLVYPGGTTTLTMAAHASKTFTPTADGVLTVTTAAGATGFTLTEGTAPTSWVPGESMPCKVVVADPDDSLTMYHGDVWRHDYSVVLREVG